MGTACEYDVIVIGGGPVGLSSAYHLSLRRVRSLVLEQFTFANQLASSAGVSRQFRIPYPERYMVQLVRQSLPFWQELQAFTDTRLLEEAGTLWFGDKSVHTSEGNIADAEEALKAEGIAYTSLDRDALERHYPFVNLPENYVGLFQSQGATINLRETIKTLLDINRRSAYVSMKSEAPATSIWRKDQKFYVTTPLGIFVAPKLILAPGPYANGLFRMLGFDIDATFWNMSSAYFKLLDPSLRYPTWFAFQNPDGENGNEFYGFPELDWNNPGYVRVASDFVVTPLSSPEQRTFVPNQKELSFTANWVREHMKGVEPTPQYTSTCLVSLSTIANKELLIDFAPASVPGSKNIVLYTTGWAAKFVPILGRILSDLSLDGRTSFDITNFQTGTNYLKML